MWSSFVGFMLRRYPRALGLCVWSDGVRTIGKQVRKLYFDPSSRVDGLSRNDEGVRAALALCAQYSGEQAIAIGLSGLVAVRAGAVSKLVREAARLLDPWGDDARIELR